MVMSNETSTVTKTTPSIFKLQKIKEKKTHLERQRIKWIKSLIYSGAKTGVITLNFSETMQMRREWNEMLTMLKGTGKPSLDSEKGAFKSETSGH